MAGTFSGHLIDSYNSFNQSRAPFGRPVHSQNLTTTGAMSFNSQMHGSFSSYPPFLDPNQSANWSGMDISQDTAQKIASLQAKLNKKLGPEYISQRPGPGGGPKLTYAEGWKIINLANEVFGFNGWSSSLVGITVDYVDFNEESRRYCVGVSAVVRVTLRDGVYHEDVGYGVLENAKSKGAALDKCKKEAVTDAVKRALRNFGNLLGNCLYDKQYTQEVVKIKVQPAKFDPGCLHRRPEFDTSASTSNVPPGPSTSANSSMARAGPANVNTNTSNVYIPKPLGQGVNGASRPPNAVPTHVRPVAMSTPASKAGAANGSSVVVKKEMVTPSKVQGGHPGVQAPANQAQQSNPASNPRSTVQPLNLNSNSNAVNTNGSSTTYLQKHTTPNTMSSATRKLAPNPHPNPNTDKSNIFFSDMDDAYSMTSDDEAFFAAVDLAEGIDLDALVGAGRTDGEEAGGDEEVGGAIDFEEGTRRMGEEDEEMDGESGGWRDVGSGAAMRQSVGGVIGRDRIVASDASSARAGGVGSGPARESGQQQGRQVNVNVASGASPKGGTGAGVRDAKQQQSHQQQQQRSAVNRTSSTGGFNFPPGMNQRSDPTSTVSSTSTTTPATISRTPSMSSLAGAAGGTGRTVDSRGSGNVYGSSRNSPEQRLQQQQQQWSGGFQSASVQVGMKRPADLMNASSGKALPNMSAGAAKQALSSGGMVQTGQFRQPLAPLALETDGNAKRIKR